MKKIIYGSQTATGDALDVTSYIGEPLPDDMYRWWNYDTTAQIYGCPVFAMVDNNPVLVCMVENLTANGGYSAKSLSGYVAQINSTMATLHGNSTEYQIISPDLTVFKEYINLLSLYDNLGSLLIDSAGSILTSL